MMDDTKPPAWMADQEPREVLIAFLRRAAIDWEKGDVAHLAADASASAAENLYAEIKCVDDVLSALDLLIASVRQYALARSEKFTYDHELDVLQMIVHDWATPVSIGKETCRFLLQQDNSKSVLLELSAILLKYLKQIDDLLGSCRQAFLIDQPRDA
ncbi:hypothetical protein TFLX_00474 [Thermoflexales bacterium]|nr:hypothetical protein TFLX_00474 [Thermoflexales bacterium]